MPKLHELAKTIRSKNAGVNQVTFDIIFPDAATYRRVVQAQVITRESVSALFRIAPSRISDFVEFDLANAIKFTIFRDRPSGGPGDWDILGCQFYGPLVDLEVP
ncbi:MAG: DUF4387 domain-containing protein [Variibacter sp.]|nr:DUF4387 domain-containing protein [Variibacter sp.]